MTRLLIADDQALVRGAFQLLLDSAPDLEVVGQAANGAEAVELAAELAPDVVLMDIRMPVMDGLEATKRILADQPQTRVLVLTTFDLDEYVYSALRSGASGFLLKDAMPDELINAVRVVAAGEALLSPRATRLLVAEFAARPGPDRPAPAALATLTDRERDVLRLIADGLSNAEICAHLVISAGTTKTHIGHLLAKLGARDRAQLVVIAYQSGLVSRTSG